MKLERKSKIIWGDMIKLIQIWKVFRLLLETYKSINSIDNFVCTKLQIVLHYFVKIFTFLSTKGYDPRGHCSGWGESIRYLNQYILII